MTWLAIAVGGAVGTCLSYALCGLWVGSFGAAAGWPLATLLVNALGSFGLGVVVSAADGYSIAGVDARLVLRRGVDGWLHHRTRHSIWRVCFCLKMGKRCGRLF